MTAGAPSRSGRRDARARMEAVLLEHRRSLTSTPVLILQLLILGANSVVFWLVAARTSTTEELGQATELYTVVLLIVFATNLGLPVVVARYATNASVPAARIYTWSVLLTTASSLVGSVVTVLVAPGDILEPLTRHGDAAAVALLFLATTGVSVATVMDNRQVGLQQHRAFIARNAVMVAARLPMLAVSVSSERGLWVWLAATMSAPVAVLATSLMAPVGPHRLGRVANARRIVGYGWVNYASTLLASAPFVILPLVVFAHVDAADNAIFYLPWQVGSLLFLIPGLIARALLIDADDDVAVLARQTRTALLACVAFGVAALIGALVVAPLFPIAYGSDYAGSGAVLVGLCLALIPYGVTATVLTIARVEADTRVTLLISGALTVLVLVPGAVWTPDRGTGGATIAWLAGHLACAIPAWLHLRRRQARRVRA